jgi:hypothetical protein
MCVAIFFAELSSHFFSHEFDCLPYFFIGNQGISAAWAFLSKKENVSD